MSTKTTVSAAQPIPSISTAEQLLNDPCTPFWAEDVISIALQKDCVNAAGVFDVLAQSFGERATRSLGAVV
jgi:hypothetical protein